ncbi:MAG: hypothetical protein V1866_03120 [archaeon]
MDLKTVLWILVGLVVASVIISLLIKTDKTTTNPFINSLGAQAQGGRMDYAVVEGVKDAQITETQYAAEPTAPAPGSTQPPQTTVPSLAPGEQTREWGKISKENFIKAVKDAYSSERGSPPTKNQLKALYSIAAFEQGAIGKKEIGAYNWNFGNIHLPSSRNILLSKMGFSRIYDKTRYLEYVTAVKKYVVDNKINLVTDIPYYWSADSNGKVGPAREYYYTQFQAFGTPAEGLRRKVSLISNTYPNALDDKKLSAVSDNGEKASIVAAGLKHGNDDHSYYELDETAYAGGLKANMDDFDRMNIN